MIGSAPARSGIGTRSVYVAEESRAAPQPVDHTRGPGRKGDDWSGRVVDAASAGPPYRSWYQPDEENEAEKGGKAHDGYPGAADGYVGDNGRMHVLAPLVALLGLDEGDRNG
jgi:hypothetical protein